MNIDESLAFFRRLADAPSIYDGFRTRVGEPTVEAARVVGGLWFHLSEHIVDILCIALAGLRSARIRHLVVQTAYEELGEDDPDQLHTELLRQTLHAAGVREVDVLAASGHRPVRVLLDSLIQRLESYRSDAEISGLLLGMELVAYENIDLVVDALSHTPDVAARVKATPWVGMHHQLEEMHIRRAIGVFVDHMTTPHDQRDFVATFVDTMDFWRAFWEAIAEEAVARRAEPGR